MDLLWKFRVTLGFALMMHATSSFAQAPIAAHENYDPYIRHRSSVSSVDGNLEFGDQTDNNSGATNFYKTVVSLSGNNQLEVALRYKYVRGRSSTTPYWVWERDDPYITGDFGMDDGWVLGNDSAPSPVRDTSRCSMLSGWTSPPVLSTGSSRPGEFFPQEYWAGYRLVLPRGGGALLNALQQTPIPNPPVTGGPYKWATNDGWFFSCIPLKNGPGEGFLAHAPDGNKYYFDDYRLGPELPTLWKFNQFDQDITLARQEIRIYASRIEDRFGNFVEGLTGSDGRVISISDLGGGTTRVTAGSQQWTVAMGEPFTVTNPDGSQWKLASNWAMHWSSGNYEGPGEFCVPVNPPLQYGGTGLVTVTAPSGARAVFSFAPIQRGYSHVPIRCEMPEGHNSLYIVDPSITSEISLVTKTIGGPGIATSWTTLNYGPPNDCYATGYRPGTCSPSSPTTVTTKKTRSDGTYAIYTFGNRYMVNQGQLLKIEEGTGSYSPIRVTDQEWQLFDGIGNAYVGRYTVAGALGSIYRIAISKRTITELGRTFTWKVNATCGETGTVLCFDQFTRPTQVTKSSALVP